MNTSFSCMPHEVRNSIPAFLSSAPSALVVGFSFLDKLVITVMRTPSWRIPDKTGSSRFVRLRPGKGLKMTTCFLQTPFRRAINVGTDFLRNHSCHSALYSPIMFTRLVLQHLTPGVGNRVQDHAATRHDTADCGRYASTHSSSFQPHSNCCPHVDEQL